jgi:hypothetical protein
MKLNPGEHQLLLDDHLLESVRNVRRTWHRPERHPANPLIVPAAGPGRAGSFPPAPRRPGDGPAAGERVALLFGSVLRDEEQGLGPVKKLNEQ